MKRELNEGKHLVLTLKIWNIDTCSLNYGRLVKSTLKPHEFFL